MSKTKGSRKRGSKFKSKSGGSSKRFKDSVEYISDKVLSRRQMSELCASMDLERMQCKVCLRSFKGVHELRRHMNEHFVNYTCEKCGKGFATRERYFQHMRVHITGLFKCSKCDQTFDTVSKLDNHKANHRASLYNCLHCKQRFKSFYTRQKHMRDAHAVMNGHECALCATVCVTHNMLAVHMRRKHETRVRTHTCDACEKEFFDKQTLVNHMIVHTGQRNYACTECKKAYARKKTLIQHMKIHNNVRDHVCSHCGQAFVQKCSLKWHMKKHVKSESSSLNIS